MRRNLLYTVLFTLFSFGTAYGQFYDTGQTAASQKWNSMRTDSLRMIFPQDFEFGARKTLFYMDTVRPYAGYGFRYGPMRTPVVFKTENFASNGLGMLAPKRIEMGGIPYSDAYSSPWLKHLAVHEYRHMVQYNNLNRSTVKALSYIFGQQISLVSTGVIPFWFLEGDAVMAETQAFEFGRALQPSFTMHYRALGDEILKKKNPDKWFSGSYKDHVPSHYELGYQLVAHSERKYDKYIWNDVFRYGANFPFLLFTTQLALNKYYKTSTKKLFRETFSYLNEYWDSIPDEKDSADIISPPVKLYTTYSHPIYIDDNTILALKQDYRKRSHFVTIDTETGDERPVRHTGPVSTRPAYRDGTVWWTEYHQSTFWEQRMNSRICYMSLDDKKIKYWRNERQGMFPTPLPDGSLAYVKYHYDGHYSIVAGEKEHEFSHDVSIHDLAYSESDDIFYCIVLGDEGMWIEGLSFEGDKSYTARLTQPAYVTLRAHEGKLYFGSIRSGKDEVHMYDLTKNREYRISTSRYGSFSPAPSPDGSAVTLTVYERDGYKTAVQNIEVAEEITPARTPDNKINPPIKKWDAIKMDEVVFTENDLRESEEKVRSKRYRKGLNLFNVHSWAPFRYDPEAIMNDLDFDINLGVTAVSQNLLGSAVSSLSYGYSAGGVSTVRGRFSYYGWAPKIEVSALWSNAGYTTNLEGDTPKGDYAAVSARVYMPILLSAGHRIRFLTPQIQYMFRNNRIYSTPDEYEFDNSMAASLSFSDNSRKARRDILPRWGYSLRASVRGNPFSTLYATGLNLYGQASVPGIVRNHGLSVAANYFENITSEKTRMIFYATSLVPRGFTDVAPIRMGSVSANYHLPIAYPDWGLSGVFFLKRITMSVGYDFAKYSFNRIVEEQTSFAVVKDQRSIYSVGGTLNFDIAFFRLPEEGTTALSLSLFFPNGKPKDAFFKVGFSIPL